jgi:flagellar basal-body rod modification protein FlgD
VPTIDPIGSVPGGLDPALFGAPSATTGAATALTTGTAGAKPPPRPNELGQEAFMKLLIAQLKYQDPMNPADGTEFIAQTAQFQMVEKLGALEKQNVELAASQRTIAGSSLVGRDIVFSNPESGVEDHGVVTAVRFHDGQAVLRVGDFGIPLASVREVIRSDEPEAADPAD